MCQAFVSARLRKRREPRCHGGEPGKSSVTTQSEGSWHGDTLRRGRGFAAAPSPARRRAAPGARRCALGPDRWMKTQAATQGRGGGAELTGTAPGFVHFTWGPETHQSANRCLFWKCLRTQRDLKMITSLKAHFWPPGHRVGAGRMGWRAGSVGSYPAEGRRFLWNRMRQGSSRLLFDDRFFTDPAPLLLSLKCICGKGACSGTDIYHIWQFKHA